MAGGRRLEVVPHPVRELLGMLFGGVVLVPLIGLPFVLPSLLVAYFSGYTLVWGLVWAELVVLGLAAVVVVVAGVVRAPMEVRWVGFRPEHDPPQVEIARLMHRSTLAMDDLRWVTVLERTKLGQRKSITVSLHTTGGTVEGTPSASAPLMRVDAQALTEWLTSELAPCGVEVEYRTEAQKTFQCPEEWLPGGQLAALWKVPPEAVRENAALHGVKSHTYTPRVSAMYNPGNTVTVYDPAHVHEVAETLRASRADPGTE